MRHGKKFNHSSEAIEEVQRIAGAFAIGRDIHVGDTIIGIKGRVGFEAAAPMVILKAHHALEKHTLTKWQLNWKDQLALFYGNWLHEGQILDPVMRDIEAFLERSQQTVTGTVYVQLQPYRFQVIGIESEYDLMSSKFGKYGEMNTGFTGEGVRGFSKIFGNQTSMVDATGARYEYAYTARNAIAEIRLIDPNGSGDADQAHPGQDGYLVLESMGYDLAGRQVRDTDAMGRSVTTEYYKDDLVHRKVLKNFHRPNGSTVDYVLEDDTYDGAGNQTKQVTDNGTRTTTVRVPGWRSRKARTCPSTSTLSFTNRLCGQPNSGLPSRRSAGLLPRAP